MKDLKHKMALICAVPISQIEYDETFQLYRCRCGCGMVLSGYFLKNAYPVERREAHRIHRMLSNGHKKAVVQ